MNCNSNFYGSSGPGGGTKKPPKGEDKKEGFSWKGSGRTFLLWAVIILTFFFIFSVLNETNSDHAAITYSEFLRYLDNDKIASVTFINRKLG